MSGRPPRSTRTDTLFPYTTLFRSTDYTVPVARDLMAKARSGVTVGVRPEAWHLAEQGAEGLPVKVTVVEELGADAFIHGTCGVAGAPILVIFRAEGRRHLPKGPEVKQTEERRVGKEWVITRR